MDEIKKAYRKLSRLYHPDANINNPNKKQAEEKFKQVQEAYNQIIAARERGETGGYGGFYGQSGQTSYGNDEEAIKMQAGGQLYQQPSFPGGAECAERDGCQKRTVVLHAGGDPCRVWGAT